MRYKIEITAEERKDGSVKMTLKGSSSGKGNFPQDRVVGMLELAKWHHISKSVDAVPVAPWPASRRAGKA